MSIGRSLLGRRRESACCVALLLACRELMLLAWPRRLIYTASAWGHKWCRLGIKGKTGVQIWLWVGSARTGC
ncbi:ORF1196 [White spot syndrome virus]|uniref:ORF1196 n=1 Tax=White spot syndrome virus TaxID=342409 RepID=A0A2D3I6F7_9VIRU|nr:ORF1196 [White spot syndrome virus]